MDIACNASDRHNAFFHVGDINGTDTADICIHINIIKGPNIGNYDGFCNENDLTENNNNNIILSLRGVGNYSDNIFLYHNEIISYE
jgi:hypothetical protein